MTTQTFQVDGMSCQHCVDAVTTEVTNLAGVTEVEVDLGAGSLTVESRVPLGRANVAAAVDGAGYELT